MNQPLYDPFSDARRLASTLGEFFRAFQEEGFSEDQAFTLVENMHAAALMQGEG